MQKIRLFLKRLKRSFDYAVFGWSNPDWDFTYLYEMMSFKMRRVLHDMETTLELTARNHVKALKLAIRISDRLAADDYDHRLYHLHEAKWGELQMQLSSVADQQGLFQVVSRGTRVENEEQAAQERADYHAMIQAGMKTRERDKDILFDLIVTYDRLWWS